MKTMLLSFKPEWFEKIKNGSKIYEYRRSFANEEVMAYMYVSSPMKMIVGKIHLGKRIDINTWKDKYQGNPEIVERIDDFLTKHQYAMPIISFQMTEGIDLEALRQFNPKFVCPQMYYYLDNYTELFEFIRKNATEKGKKQMNYFENASIDEICRQKY
jgi:predicted transcriptional regulator